MSYKSKHTGAQVDEAVSKVLNGDIEGSNIKEGSIPLSALDENVKRELNVKFGLSDYIGTLTKNGDNLTFSNTIFLKDRDRIGECPPSSGEYDLSSLFNGGPDGKLTVVYDASSDKFKATLINNDSGYWNITVYNNMFNKETPTPDWNAQEGEAGYIEHRTHYERSQSIELKDVECSEYIDLVGTNEYFGELIERATKIIVDYSFTEYDDSDPENIYEESYSGHKEIQVTAGQQYTEWLDTLQFYIETVKDADIGEGNVITVMQIFVGPPIKDGYFKITVECEPKQLDEKFIPDTVLKTTSQTLTNTDKNQALTNLGIDPVVWNYMCNPFMVATDYELSYDIHNMIWHEEAYRLRPVILNTAQVLYNGTPYKVNKLIGTNKLGISTSDGEVVYEYDKNIKQFKIVEQ
jgi:hypothetical protein